MTYMVMFGRVTQTRPLVVFDRLKEAERFARGYKRWLLDGNSPFDTVYGNVEEGYTFFDDSRARMLYINQGDAP